MKIVGIRSTLCAVFTAAVLVLPTLSTMAAPGDEHWDNQFGWPGTTNTIASIATHNNRLYIGGYYNPSNAAVTVWDGTRWSGVGRFVGNSVQIWDLAFVGEVLYAAGSFTNVDGTEIRGLARWDGAAWSGVGLNGPAFALAVDGADLYVGGAFTNAGDVAITNIGRWDGSAWHALGDGIGGSLGDAVRALVATNGTVYAGGYFTNAGSTAVDNIACWNGSAWTPLGTGLSSLVYALALNGTDLYAGGVFTQAGSTVVNRVAKWDGVNWTALGTGVSGGTFPNVLGLAVLGDLVCVGGNFTSAGGVPASRFAVWNGSSWSAASGGVSAGVLRITSTGTNVFVGGSFLLAGGVIGASIASWDGVNWSSIGPSGRVNGVSSVVRAFATDGSNIFVGGAFTAAGQIAANRVARFDGTTWHPLGSGMNDTVDALAFVGGNLYAAGEFSSAGGVTAVHIARWDGNTWSAVGGIGIGGSVATLAVHNDELYVAGNFQVDGPDGRVDSIARWDGANWRKVIQLSPTTLFGMIINDAGFGAVAFQGNDIYIGGRFYISEFDGPTCFNIMRFDGTYCRLMGTGVNTNVTSIAVIGSDVYVGGRITNAGGVAVSRVAKWDGANWSGVGGGLSGTASASVTSLATIGNDLYAAGSFTNASGVSANRIAKWDGTNWSPLGSGVTFPGFSSASISTIRAFGNDLYAGGTFLAAGGKPSCYLGHWNDTRNFDLLPVIELSKLLGAGGIFKFRIETTGVSEYVIEATTNLATWIPVDTNSASFYEFWDTTAGARPYRLYRARSSH